MRVASAAKAKQPGKGQFQALPGEGTYIRAIYDMFAARKGEVIEWQPGVRAPLNQLRDIYGLDIRCLRRHSKNRPGLWVLAGEWFGADYVDYLSAGERPARAGVLQTSPPNKARFGLRSSASVKPCKAATYSGAGHEP